MVAFDLEKIFQYPAGMDLLSAILVEHERLLWELQKFAKDAQRETSSDHTNRLNLIKTQILLFERLMIGEKIDSLVLLVKHYAEILSKPHIEIRKAMPQ
jgi:hypothetical protein